MKTARKIFTLVVVLAMVFAMSVPAFAAGNYTIIFKTSGTSQPSWTTFPLEGKSVYTGIIEKFGTNAQFNQLSNGHYVLTNINGFASAPSSTAPSSFPNATAVPNHLGYFLIETGPQGYHYVYAGNDWTYHYYGGGDLWDYMDQHFPVGGSVIEVEYSMQVTDWWTTEEIT